ncbi:Tm-1-like ATP-binding domain-containing protein [Clostridium sp. CF011]|uniref:Tm-1-like ATP-binding domain-containing protein n=1 Tax=unclassified Clostridium TaxID=2614128 RepID=UPI001C0DB91C|nr:MULTISPECIES: Tm-1-like ATP-binding domain-containing protein [unclassified Clostridium]MBU3093295.1 Tm-1-like ATP-binding domain-containing protein [Clostridium sp. CF011]MBW9146704.1 Tm-1-like ATP-binding domain-containing protein [Clostridium sp. CM027]UVE41635.1 Tm-1-like ATP-binding domain-containing protein [Clostridium sp. CM027]WAG70628.1 Tm-1-like ATP-binding domain-containing protein [Clostridium sp. CF011]
MKTIAIAGTFDTKGDEYLYVKELIEGLGLSTFTIHTGVFKPTFKPDVSNNEVAEIAGVDIKTLVDKKDRALATEILSKGMEKLAPKLYKEGKFDGIISLGGSGGTSLVTPAMRALPIGVPKVMVSTVASGNTAPYVGTSDIVMMPSVVDVSGLNSISTKIFANAVFAIAGMVKFENIKVVEKKKLIAATMFGVTTPCVTAARKYLEDRGYEVLVFHATGIGGQSMEALIEAGFIEGVLDLTTTEWADEVIGGVLNAGEHRLEAASKNHVPQVVSVGALDMCNFGTYDTVPKKFEGRNFYKHNPTVTLMRTNVAENEAIGKKLVEKLNMAKEKTALFLPLRGISGIDVEGQEFYGVEEDKMLFDTLRNGVNKNIVEVIEMDCEINNAVFAEVAAQKLIDLMSK